MENRVKKKINGYFNVFKDDIVNQLSEVNDPELKLKLVSYISEYPRMNFTDEDFSKRKRVKNHVPEYDRCGAKRADGLQCTRRKKDSDMFCGTHLKGTPHGEIGHEILNARKKIELTLHETNGISHYTDDTGKQYSAEMVLSIGNENKKK
uniref:Uncharacterized protein n=1 Tax=viral metagenome TaxID=1070528 RepID=A0A6C0LG07_9ZZZZ